MCLSLDASDRKGQAGEWVIIKGGADFFLLFYIQNISFTCGSHDVRGVSDSVVFKLHHILRIMTSSLYCFQTLDGNGQRSLAFDRIDMSRDAHLHGTG